MERCQFGVLEGGAWVLLEVEPEPEGGAWEEPEGVGIWMLWSGHSSVEETEP